MSSRDRMIPNMICLAVLMVTCILLSACGASAPENREESTAAPAHGPERVVALSRSVGELWTLAGGELCGVTEDAKDLQGLKEDVSLIGSLSRPSLEAILACEPDLVMLTEDLSAHKEIAQQLRDMKIPVLTIDLEGFDDFAEVMKDLTGRTGREDLYQKNVEEVRKRIDEITADAGKKEPEGGSSFLCMRVSATKNKVLKQDYFACAIMTDLGLKNIAGSDSALDELNLEAIVRADPAWIFIVLQGDEDEAMAAYRDAFASQSVWSDLTAVQQDRVIVLPKDLFQYKPNARWDEAYRYVFEILFP